MKKSVYIATSIDGYIARKDGDIDWLTNIESMDAEEDYGYSDFFASVSCLVMGRNTFEKVMTFPEWPYGEKRVIVMTKSLTALPRAVQGKAEIFSGAPSEIVEKLEKEGEGDLYIDGGKVIQSFLCADLIDEIVLTRIPILIGEGIPLFGPVEEDIKLEYIETRHYENGLVQTRYRCLHRDRN